MSRPLWQILFTMSFAAFATARVVVPYTLHPGPVPPPLLFLWGAVVLGSALVFVGAWMERRWPLATLTGAVGALLVGASLLEAHRLGAPPAGGVAEEASLVALLTGILVLALRRSDRHGGRRARARSEAGDARKRLEALRR